MRAVNNVARFIFPQAYFVSGQTQARQKAVQAESASLLIEPPQYCKWNEFLQEEFSDQRLLEKRAALLTGKVLHEILAAIGNLAVADKEQSLQQGLSRARDLFPEISDFSAHEAMVRRVLAAEELKQFFYLAGAEVFQEKEVVDRLGITKRIDRLIIREKEAWVVDYKTRQEPQLDYRQQVEEYKAIIKELCPKHVVKGFLIYLDELKVEEVNG
jgi:ATP-dependent exoDNAse (exonuclease V) beta subunit